MSYSLVGTAWNLVAFDKYLTSIDVGWASSVTLHHTGFPDLAMRKNGLIVQHIKNIKSYYQGKGWSAGPHLFIDDHDINGMSPLTGRGVHARSFNSNSIGIEVLGNYDKEDPKTGRGWECWKLAAKTVAAILRKMGKEPSEKTILFHRDDPKTRKTCPGTKVNKAWFIALVKAEMEGGIVSKPVKEDGEHIKAIKYQLEKILEENQNLELEQIEDIEKRLCFIKWRLKKITDSHD